MKIERLRFAQPLFRLNPQSIPLVQTGKAIMKNEIDTSEALRNKPFMKICMIAACVIFCLYIISSFVFGMAKIRPYLPLCLVIMGCFFCGRRHLLSLDRSKKERFENSAGLNNFVRIGCIGVYLAPIFA